MLQIKILLILCTAVLYSKQCIPSTFSNTVVQIKLPSETIKVLANDCIAQGTIKEPIFQIKITKQDVPDLNRGCVQNISSSFKIFFNNNNIDIIRKEAFLNLPGLKEIDLSSNKITWISKKSFTNLPALEKINLMHNKIEIKQQAFSNLKSLETVDLQFNKLESFEQEWFDETPSLKEIALRNNLLSTLPKAAFITLPNLQQLHLENNRLEYIDEDAFKGLRNLQRIYFASNRLKQFDINFNTPSKIIYMGIQFNNITYISPHVLNDVQSSLQKFWITGNPFQCPCFYMIKNWGSDYHVQIAHKCTKTKTTCVFPKSNPSTCMKRRDDDFSSGFYSTFGDEYLCGPGDDY